MEQLAVTARPLRVAVVGSGPAGLYAVDALLKKRDLVLSIDIFNRFPTPFGLVRDGVAPDHQSIKSVIRVFEKTLADPRVRFFGNVTYGKDIHHQDLLDLYDQVIYAVGAQADRRMGIPGEDLANSLPATAFVGWYNGHPDYSALPVDLECERAIVVGNGNVAMDVARILVMDPEELAKSDITDHALAKLRSSKVREVVVLGRRGPLQAAFKTPEIKELGTLKDVDVVVDPADLAFDAETLEAAKGDRGALANLEFLRSYAARQESTAERRIVMRFLASPVEVLGNDGHVSAVRIEKNKLVDDGHGGLRAQGTGSYETLEAGLILRSVGYRSVPIEEVPFNEKKYTINNVAGRVVQEDGTVVPGEYVVGWAKRGPSGLIGNNKPDSVATVNAMLEDLPQLGGIADEKRDPALIEQLLCERGIDFVSYKHWQLLDKYEVSCGASRNCPRIKLTSVSEMMAVIRGELEKTSPAMARVMAEVDAEQ